VTNLVVAPVVTLLATAVLGLTLRNHDILQERATAAGFLAYSALTAVLVERILTGGAVAFQVGDWAAPFGITLVADALSGLMLSIVAVVGTVSVLYRTDVGGADWSLLPLLSFMCAGASGAFLTGDLFNLFVWLEVTLMSSYVLIALRGNGRGAAATLRYLVVNLVGSSFILVAIGGIYSTMGTLNMADLSRRLAEPAAYDASPNAALGFFGVLLCVFALKSGLAPFQFWVPEAYRAAPPAASAVMSGIAKKVGIYAIVRVLVGVLGASSATYQVLGTGLTPVEMVGGVLAAMASLSIAVGGIGALSTERLDGLLSYSSIGQVGFIALPVAVYALTGSDLLFLAGGLLYAVNHAVGKSMLFLISGLVERSAGSQRIEDVSGLVSWDRGVSAAFFVGALSMIGVPPLAGFLGKLQAFRAVVSLPSLMAVGVGGAFLSILYLTRAWISAFWGEPVEAERVSRGARAAVLFLALLLVAGGLAAEPLVEFSKLAAEAATNQEAYRAVVLGGDAP